MDSKSPTAWIDDATQGMMLNVSLNDADPPVSRLIAVPSTIPLDRLHDVIQIVMGWEDRHLHRFCIGDVRFTESGTDVPDDERLEEGVPLEDVLKPTETFFTYLYDFGDSWDHKIEVCERFPVESGMMLRLSCMEGTGKAPIEDCGGIDALNDLRRGSTSRSSGSLKEDQLDAINTDLYKYTRWSRERRALAENAS